MDIYSKVFIINAVVFFFTLWMDKVVFDDFIANIDNFILDLWALISVTSIPAWIIYIIIRYY